MTKIIEIRNFYDEEDLLGVASIESFGRIPMRGEEIVLGIGEDKRNLLVNRVVHGNDKVVLYATEM